MFDSSMFDSSMFDSSMFDSSMFDSSSGSTAPRYGISAAVLIMALLLCVLIASGPAGYASFSLALAASLSCLVVARVALARWPTQAMAKTGRAR